MKIFCDTEFSDFINTDPISIGLVTEDGKEEFYAENLDSNPKLASQFVKDNIYPLLCPEKYGMRSTELSARMLTWFDELPCDEIIIVADYPTDWDIVRYFIDDECPKIKGWQNIWNNISEWSQTIAPNNFFALTSQMSSCFTYSVSEYFLSTRERGHHALSDAKANRAAYLSVCKQYGMPL